MDTIFSNLQAALFDLDGTLIETHIDFDLMKREMLALAARRGVPGEGLEGLDILACVEESRRRLEALGRALEAADLRRDAFRMLEEIEVAHCAAPVEMTGAAELAAALRARGVPVGIVTRNCRAVSERLLRHGGLHCDALLTRDDVPVTKPDPSHLFAALDALAAPGGAAIDRAAAVMVGDHWMDIRAGRLAAMRTVGVLRGRPADIFAPEPPDVLVEGPGDLLALLTGAPAS